MNVAGFFVFFTVSFFLAKWCLIFICNCAIELWVFFCQNSFVKEFFATLVDVEEIAPGIKFFDFQLHEDSRDFSFSTGQFISVRVGPQVFRAYSLCTCRKDLPRFSLVIKLIPGGIGSTFFDKLQPGQQIPFQGPFGLMQLDQDVESGGAIFIATGVGIAPMRAFWRQLFSGKKATGQFDLFFGFRHESDGIFLPDIFALQKEFSENFHVTLCVSKPLDTLPPNFQLGRVTAALGGKPEEFFTNRKIFLCGSRQMVEQVKEILQAKGVDRANIFQEIY